VLPADLNRAVNRQPFEPFRLVPRDGLLITVRAPQDLAVSPSGKCVKHANEQGSITLHAAQITALGPVPVGSPGPNDVERHYGREQGKRP